MAWKDGGDESGRRPAIAFAYRPATTRGVFSPQNLERLASLCDIVDPIPLQRFDEPRAREALARTEILITGWGCPRLDRSVLACAPRLRLIAHAAGSVKSFIGRDVLDSGIAVTTAAAANAIPVAEYTLAAILFANKRVMEFRTVYRNERGSLRAHPLMASRLGNLQKIVGIVGASRIGLRVVELLKPFDVCILLHDPYLTRAEAARLGAEWCELDDLVSRSDVVSLHAPALESTRHMIDARRLELMQDGATFINTARGSLVEHGALERELVSQRISAVLDVTEPEVLPANSPLYDLPNVLLTPHIAGAIGVERDRLGTLVVREVERYLNGEPLQHRLANETFERQA